MIKQRGFATTKCIQKLCPGSPIKMFKYNFIVYRQAMDNSSLEESVFNMFKNPENNLVNIGQIITVRKILVCQYKRRFL